MYKLYSPGGNDTALVLGLENDETKRKKIKDIISEKHPEIEQVGFIDPNNNMPQLIMTSGEFCGNATRTAVWQYLEGKPGLLNITVSGVDEKCEGGITAQGDVWVKMPIHDTPEKIMKKEEGLYHVELKGISHLVVSQCLSHHYLTQTGHPFNGKKLLKHALEMLTTHELHNRNAVGVMFTEDYFGMLKMHPCVFIKKQNTSYYETACGSGCAAVGLVYSLLKRHSVKLPLLQPSNYVLETDVVYEPEAHKFKSVTVSGPVSHTGDGKI
jgi:diaminopimelate epimerase